jgi:translation initiation factor IF-2
LTIVEALSGEEGRTRSLASVRRAREKERQKQQAQARADGQKIVRDVVIPENISVQELANRMAERGTDVIKALMKMDVMASMDHVVDADTAELVVAEFGHKVKRVSESDVELGLEREPDADADLVYRPPVVTVMGHVDHGKTSLLDALRETDVAAGEAGGITQHIGAYQVEMSSGAKITFIDTPGHEAFTAMRARGAKVTDIVVLVVAADDGVMPQTVEAIHHAKAADVPIIIAVNKIDKSGADPTRVRTDLLQQDIVVEEMSGDILSVDVSATARTNLKKLEEVILLQAEILDLKANPNRAAEGVIVESKIDVGRGPVATLLVQRGTLKVGDVFVAGSEWGRVRALGDYRGEVIQEAGPAMPVEVLGLNGAPAAGDDFVVVDNEARAREIAEFRQRRDRDARVMASSRGTVEEMFEKLQEGEVKELPVVIKGDVQGSVEAIQGMLEKLSTDKARVEVLHSAVGGINESDVTLAKAAKALIIGFNVRANPQAREMVRRDGVEIRYYSVIYDVGDDLKRALTGMLDPIFKENFIGYAEIREVFNVSKVGKVAGCMITEGLVRRGAKVRLLRDDVVIHKGALSQLKRFKDDVKEVKEGTECGMAFANYQDIKDGDFIECFEVEEIAPEL